MTSEELTAERREDLLYEAVYHWLQCYEIGDLVDRYRSEEYNEEADYIEEHETEIVSIAAEAEELIQKRVSVIAEAEE